MAHAPSALLVRATDLARSLPHRALVLHFVLGAGLFSLSNCARPAAAPVITLSTIGEPAMMCYVHGTSDTALVDTRIIQMRELWAVTGNVQSSRASAGQHHRVKVEAVTADESLVLATLSPPRRGDGAPWTFHLPIPAPTVFDHLHLAIVSTDEAFETLPPHERRYH